VSHRPHPSCQPECRRRIPTPHRGDRSWARTHSRIPFADICHRHAFVGQPSAHRLAAMRSWCSS